MVSHEFPSRPDARSFDVFYAQFGPQVFASSFEVRRRIDHSGELPAACASLDDACHACLERHHDLVVSLFGTVFSRLGDPGLNVAAYLRSAAPGRAQGLEQDRATRLGMIAKPDRFINETQWIRGPLPDLAERAVLRLMLHFVRSSDRPDHGSDYAVTTFAAKLGIDPAWVADRVLDVPARISASSDRGARFVAANLTEALERKQARCGAEHLEDLPAWREPGTSPTDRPVEDLVVSFTDPVPVEDLLAAQAAEQDADDETERHLVLIDRLREDALAELAAQDTPDPAEALRAAARRCLTRAQAEALRERPDLVQLARDLLRAS